MSFVVTWRAEAPAFFLWACHGGSAISSFGWPVKVVAFLARRGAEAVSFPILNLTLSLSALLVLGAFFALRAAYVSRAFSGAFCLVASFSLGGRFESWDLLFDL